MKLKQLDTSQIDTVNAELEEKLKNERKEWNEKLEELIRSIGYNNKLSGAQIYQLSYRQMIIEQIANYKVILEKQQEKLDAQLCSRFRDYTLLYDIKLSSSEKTQFAQTDLKSYKLQVKLIETQIQYFQECIKTLDNLGFAIKNRITIVQEEIM